MTSEVKEIDRILDLEGRVKKLEKAILEKEDVLNANFEGYETLSEEEMMNLEASDKEIKNGHIISLDEALEDLE